MNLYHYNNATIEVVRWSLLAATLFLAVTLFREVQSGVGYGSFGRTKRAQKPALFWLTVLVQLLVTACLLVTLTRMRWMK